MQSRITKKQIATRNQRKDRNNNDEPTHKKVGGV